MLDRMFAMPKSAVGVLIYGLIWWMAIAVAILAFIKKPVEYRLARLSG